MTSNTIYRNLLRSSNQKNTWKQYFLIEEIQRKFICLRKLFKHYQSLRKLFKHYQNYIDLIGIELHNSIGIGLCFTKFDRWQLI